MSQFPKAVKAPTYEIDGVLHKRIPAIDAMKNPEAIRAALPISKGPDKGGIDDGHRNVLRAGAWNGHGTTYNGTDNMNVNIAPDFAGLWDALDADTLAILEENNLADPKHERLPAVPVWTNGPKPNIILDCHHTHSIRKRHRLTIRYSKLEFPDRDAAMDYARRIQLGRRNLTESQMALAVAEWKKNRRKQGQPAENRLNSTISLDGMAKVAGVGRSTMIAATKVADKSPPQIVKAVAAGEVKVSDAVAVLELSPKEQLAALAAKRKGKVKTLRGAAFDPEQLEKQPARQQTPKKSGKPVITKENRTDAQKHLGGLIRALKALDIYDEFVQALSAIATRLKKI